MDASSGAHVSSSPPSSTDATHQRSRHQTSSGGARLVAAQLDGLRLRPGVEDAQHHVPIAVPADQD
eukprot:scaffold9737_cov72-Phaeocystis_antarctica.AAC.4